MASVGENVVSLLLLEYVCLNAILYIPTYYILISLRKMSPESSKKYCSLSKLPGASSRSPRSGASHRGKNCGQGVRRQVQVNILQEGRKGSINGHKWGILSPRKDLRPVLPIKHNFQNTFFS